MLSGDAGRITSHARMPTPVAAPASTAINNQAVVGPIHGSKVATPAVSSVPRPMPVNVTPLTRGRSRAVTAVRAVLTPRTINQAPAMPATKRQALIQVTPQGIAQAMKLSTVTPIAETTSGLRDDLGATSARIAPRQ